MKKNPAKAARVTSEVLAEVIPVACVHDDYIDDRSKKERRAKRYCEAFCAKMQTVEPFATPDEAVAALAPVAVWFIGWAARQFAIMIIKALWHHWHQPEPE